MVLFLFKDNSSPMCRRKTVMNGNFVSREKPFCIMKMSKETQQCQRVFAYHFNEIPLENQSIGVYGIVFFRCGCWMVTMMLLLMQENENEKKKLIQPKVCSPTVVTFQSIILHPSFRSNTLALSSLKRKYKNTLISCHQQDLLKSFE